MSKYPEAISYFKKALVLDPENDTYKSNLKIAEQKHKEATSPVSRRAHAPGSSPARATDGVCVWGGGVSVCPQIAAGLGFDMASLINNPAFISMVRARTPQLRSLSVSARPDPHPPPHLHS